MAIYIYSQRIPAEYQEVEYIQSSGTQYLTIGSSFKTSYKVVIDFQMTVTGGDYIPVGIKYSTTRYGIDAYNSNFMVNGGGQTWVNTISEDTNRHTITIDKGTAIVDGNNYSVSYTNYTFSQGIGVFCYNEYDKSPQYNYKSSNKLYKLDIYDENGTHIHDIVPCYRKLDGEIGLYDLVDGGFYANQGTGTFTKGADITGEMELKNAYIGSIRKPSAKTVAYFPFKDDIDDHSGNGVTISNTQYLSKQEIGYKWQFSQGATGLSIGLSFENADAKFVSIWYKVLASSGNAGVLGLDKYGSAGYAPSHGNTSLSGKFNIFTSSSWAVGGQSSGLSFNEWHNITVGYDGSKVVISKDGVESTLYNGAGYNFGNGVGIISGGNNANMQILISEFICETENWSSQKKLDYYNTTKGNYGL